MNTLRFTSRFRAPRERVWNTLFDADTYPLWTRAFCEGSRFEGSWEEGAGIRFLGPDGSGMLSRIAASRPPEFLSIEHLGEIRAGVEDTTSEAGRAWAPAYENYTFADVPGGTEVRVSIEVVSEWEGFMLETFPKALRKLKSLCEGSRSAGVDA